MVLQRPVQGKSAKLIEDAPLLVEDCAYVDKIRLLDIVEDKDGALDRILLNSGMLTEKNSEHTVIQNWWGVEFHN